MSLHRWIGAVTLAAVVALPPAVPARGEAERTDIGALTARCRWLITEFDHAIKSVPSSSAAAREAWKLRAQGADECFGDESRAYTMKFGVADLARALREIGAPDDRAIPAAPATD